MKMISLVKRLLKSNNKLEQKGTKLTEDNQHQQSQIYELQQENLRLREKLNESP